MSTRSVHRFVVKDKELVGRQRDEPIGMPIVVRELDLEDARLQDLHDRTDLSALETLIGQIPGSGDDIEDFHAAIHIAPYRHAGE